MNNQEKYNDWLTEDFLLDEISRDPDINERLVKLYDYFKLQAEYDDEVENNE